MSGDGPRRLYAAHPDCVELAQGLVKELRTEAIAGLLVVTVDQAGAHRTRWGGDWTTLSMIGALELAKFEIGAAASEQADSEPTPPATA
jgi:hypothetical protein